MADGAAAPCWCTELPPAVALPREAVGCWCPACLRAHIAALQSEPPAGIGPAA